MIVMLLFVLRDVAAPSFISADRMLDKTGKRSIILF